MATNMENHRDSIKFTEKNISCGNETMNRKNPTCVSKMRGGGGVEGDPLSPTKK